MLFDGAESLPVENEVLVIEDGRIIRGGGRLQRRAPVLDADGLAILPGLIDLHVHFGAPVGDDLRRSQAALVWDYARQKPGHRRAFLAAGITSVRSVGDVIGVWRDIVNLKRRSASPGFRGPRVFTAGPLFTAPGGHPVATVFRQSGFVAAHAAREVARPDAARSEVRRLAARGVDGIKAVYDSGGGAFPRLDRAVLEAVADEAHSRGLWVAVHTASADEAREASLAGADTIEHGVTDGSVLDDQTIELMRSRKATYVPTLAVLEATAALVATGEPPRGFPADPWEALVARFDRLGADPLRTPMANVGAAARAGVRIGAGTDAQGAGMSFGESLHRELELLVRAGLSPSEALLAATREAAVALGVDDLGRATVGARADLVLVSGFPWESIADVRNVRAVVRAGRCVAGAPELVPRRPRTR
jgi:imidazolonepropionase-like amidohydrolase